MTGRELARRLQTGPVTLRGYLIHGDVGLAGRSVGFRLTCYGCRFDGSLVASGATFTRAVDLRYSEIVGPARLDGASFDELLASNASFDRGANFSLATFSGFTTFERTVFTGAMNFSLAHFYGDAVFANGEARQATRPCWLGRPTCKRPSVYGAASFTRSTFEGASDFSFFVVYGQAAFNGSQFKKLTDFGAATFNRTVSFDRARFGSGAIFSGAKFLGESDSDSFKGAISGGDLDFRFARFQQSTDFSDAVVKGELSFDKATFTVAGGMQFSELAAGAFVMSVRRAVDSVMDDDRPKVLALIESSAKDRGDLGVANDAHYAGRVLHSHGYPWRLRVLDYVFYRAFAGYLVRPLNPLLALLALAAAFTLARAARAGERVLKRVHGLVGLATAPRLPAALVRLIEGRPADAARADSGGSKTRRAVGMVPGLPGAFVETLALIGPRRDGAAGQRPRRFEAFAYRVLLACALIGFANSNPTLRQMIDAIH